MEGFKLNKLLVFIRHAHREPIQKLSRFEPNVKPDHYDVEAELTDHGRSNAKLLGEKFMTKHKLDPSLNFNTYTSPAKRCVDTLSSLKEGLSLGSESIVHPNLKYFIEKDFLFDFSFESVSVEFREQNAKLIDRIKSEFNFHPELNTQIYDVQSSLECYRVTKPEIYQQIDADLIKEIEIASTKIINLLFEKHSLIEAENLLSVIKEFMPKTDLSVNICCTHDTLIFAMAKCIQIQNGQTDFIPLCDFCSSISFVEWVNDKPCYPGADKPNSFIDVYYDDIYLGKFS